MCKLKISEVFEKEMIWMDDNMKLIYGVTGSENEALTRYLMLI